MRGTTMHADSPLIPTDIDICVDCLTIISSGIDDGLDDSERERLESVAGALSTEWPGDPNDYTTSPAVTPGRRDDDPDAPSSEPSFSWAKCDGCGSSKGGDRYPATGWYLDDVREALGW
jgi:hypothetical protein